MAYTVHQFAQIANITVRTLHHYDRIGLLKPAVLRPNGYRVYEAKELLRLQQILFFRELEFPLRDIKKILDAPEFDMIESLNAQKKMLMLKRQRMDQLLKTLTNTLQSMKKKQRILPHELYDGFTKSEMKAYQKEAKQRWGHTEAWRQSQERTKHWTKEDYRRVQSEGEAILNKIVLHMAKGSEDEEVQTHIADYHRHMNAFYDCSMDIFRQLGQMYSEDLRFAAFYEKIHPGLAHFMTEAILFYTRPQAGSDQRSM